MVLQVGRMVSVSKQAVPLVLYMLGPQSTADMLTEKQCFTIEDFPEMDGVQVTSGCFV